MSSDSAISGPTARWTSPDILGLDSMFPKTTKPAQPEANSSPPTKNPRARKRLSST